MPAGCSAMAAPPNNNVSIQARTVGFISTFPLKIGISPLFSLIGGYDTQVPEAMDQKIGSIQLPVQEGAGKAIDVTDQPDQNVDESMPSRNMLHPTSVTTDSAVYCPSMKTLVKRPWQTSSH